MAVTRQYGYVLPCRSAVNSATVTLAAGEVSDFHSLPAASEALSLNQPWRLQAAELTGSAVITVVTGTGWVAG